MPIVRRTTSRLGARGGERATTMRDVGDRAQDAVAVIVERDRHLAIPIDHDVRGSRRFRPRFEDGRRTADADWRLPADEPQQAIEPGP